MFSRQGTMEHTHKDKLNFVFMSSCAAVSSAHRISCLLMPLFLKSKEINVQRIMYKKRCNSDLAYACCFCTYRLSSRTARYSRETSPDARLCWSIHDQSVALQARKIAFFEPVSLTSCEALVAGLNEHLRQDSSLVILQ